MDNLLVKLRKSLKNNSDEKTRSIAQRFFKEKVKFYGVKSSAVGKISQEYFIMIKDRQKEEIFLLCEELYKSGYSEEAWIAADWADRVKGQYSTGDIEIFEKWLEKYITDWAKCDTLCNHAIGDLIQKFPQHINRLKKWTKSKNRWLRRAAAVSLIVPAKRGEFLNDIFEITGCLLMDSDDMVQKGYGWLLKEASRKHHKEVFDYVINNKKIMPRTSLRYAIEKMPADLKKQAMVK